MKKTLRILTLAVLLALIVSTAAFAKAGVGNPTGTVTEVGEGTVTIELEDGTLLVLTLPEGYDLTGFEAGDLVVAKGAWTDEGFDAEWVRLADEVEEGEETEVEEPEEIEEPEEPEEGEEGEEGEDGGWGEGGVYCNDGKENPHPVAQKISDKYGVSVEWVMTYTCDGFGFGGVMLALQTASAKGEDTEDAGEELTGDDAENPLEGAAGEVLAKKKDGQGWGQIWKEDGLTKGDKADSPPPGQLKKEEKQNGPPEDKGPNKEKPPKTNNGKKPNKNNTSETGGEDDAEGQ